jgi:hypothetical protein
VSDLNNKHLPSDIDSLTRKDLVEIYHIHVEEMQTAQKRIADLEEALLWSRDSNTGFEPSVSVMHRYYDELLPKGGEQ